MNKLQLIKLKINKDNLLEIPTRDILYQAFRYDLILKQENRLKKNYLKTCKEVDSKVNNVHDMTFAEHRLNHFIEDLSEAYKGRRLHKLFTLNHYLSNYGIYNEIPRILIEIIGPRFFDLFPNGEIWFVEASKNMINKIWEDQQTLLKDFNIEAKNINIPNLVFAPHEFSGLEGGFSIIYWISLMLYGFYPLALGTISTADARLMFLFFPDKPFNAFNEYKFDLFRELEFDLIGVYSDNANIYHARGIKSRFPFSDSHLNNNKNYYEWYINQCNVLLNQLLNITDIKKRYLLTMTLNRIAVDCRLISHSELPYLTKTIFFSVLDKFANLFIQLRLAQNETEIWKKLLTLNIFQKYIQDKLKDIPDSFGNFIIKMANRLYNEIDEYGPTPDIIREIRNSYHGYGIKEIDKLLSHSGEISNDLPFLSIVLWHWLLSNGLPKYAI